VFCHLTADDVISRDQSQQTGLSSWAEACRRTLESAVGHEGETVDDLAQWGRAYPGGILGYETGASRTNPCFSDHSQLPLSLSAGAGAPGESTRTSLAVLIRGIGDVEATALDSMIHQHEPSSDLLERP
jgi:hypothetical protein